MTDPAGPGMISSRMAVGNWIKFRNMNLSVWRLGDQGINWIYGFVWRMSFIFRISEQEVCCIELEWSVYGNSASGGFCIIGVRINEWHIPSLG
jgi:hypothetical protein